MADNPLTLEKMLRGSQNLDVWDVATNGDENTDWTNLVGDNGPSLKKAIKLIMQKAPIESTPFATKAALLADTTLADNAFAFVYNDTDDNNGLYQKISGVWQYQKWNPLNSAKQYTDATASALINYNEIIKNVFSYKYANLVNPSETTAGFVDDTGSLNTTANTALFVTGFIPVIAD